MEGESNLNIIEFFFNIMNGPVERDCFFEYMEDCWVAERQRREYQRCRRQTSFSNPGRRGLSLLSNKLSYLENIIEISKIILSNVKYIFIVINDNYTRFIFSQ